MKQIFDWMHEHLEAMALAEYPNTDKLIVLNNIERLLNEAEVKFGKEIVSLETYKQVAWERDIAIEQLHELGYEFGEKIREADCCEYKHDKCSKLCKSGCNGWLLEEADAWHFKYCPYCGKSIKISEVE